MNDLITLREAGQRVPGGPVSDVTVWRWTQGLPNKSGEIVKLEHLRAGKRMLTTEQHLRTFFERLAQ